ncbi:hypothetical protein BGZ49_004630, partial [Haplosporangium sp. Z 27]
MKPDYGEVSSGGEKQLFSVINAARENGCPAYSHDCVVFKKESGAHISNIQNDYIKKSPSSFQQKRSVDQAIAIYKMEGDRDEGDQGHEDEKPEGSEEESEDNEKECDESEEESEGD